MGNKKIGFGFRFEKELAVKARAYCSENGLSMGKLVGTAFECATKLHFQRKITFNNRSGFLNREEQAKVETVLRLESDLHDAIREYAVSYRRSMAEVIRISLEIFLDLQNCPEKSDGKPVHYSLDSGIVQQFRVFLAPFFYHPWTQVAEFP